MNCPDHNPNPSGFQVLVGIPFQIVLSRTEKENSKPALREGG